MEIVKVSFRNFKKVVEIAVRAIKEGKVIVCPTDTVYGLLADARDEKAVKKLFKIKKRPEGKPMPIFVKDIKMARQCAIINKTQEKFLKKVWPGKVTVVLERKDNLPEILFSKVKTIGLRIPNYRLINILLEKSNSPLTGTSANISEKPPSTRIKEIINQFRNRRSQPDLILNNGNLNPSFASTVIDLVSKIPKILRGGAEKIKVKKLIKPEGF